MVRRLPVLSNTAAPPEPTLLFVRGVVVAVVSWLPLLALALTYGPAVIALSFAVASAAGGVLVAAARRPWQLAAAVGGTAAALALGVAFLGAGAWNWAAALAASGAFLGVGVASALFGCAAARALRRRAARGGHGQKDRSAA